jgi:hypothetical protein
MGVSASTVVLKGGQPREVVVVGAGVAARDRHQHEALPLGHAAVLVLPDLAATG